MQNTRGTCWRTCQPVTLNALWMCWPAGCLCMRSFSCIVTTQRLNSMHLWPWNKGKATEIGMQIAVVKLSRKYYPCQSCKDLTETFTGKNPYLRLLNKHGSYQLSPWDISPVPSQGIIHLIISKNLNCNQEKKQMEFWCCSCDNEIQLTMVWMSVPKQQL